MAYMYFPVIWTKELINHEIQLAISNVFYESVKDWGHSIFPLSGTK